MQRVQPLSQIVVFVDVNDVAEHKRQEHAEGRDDWRRVSEKEKSERLVKIS